jgi:hypothetical protein
MMMKITMMMMIIGHEQRKGTVWGGEISRRGEERGEQNLV